MQISYKSMARSKDVATRNRKGCERDGTNRSVSEWHTALTHFDSHLAVPDDGKNRVVRKMPVWHNDGAL
jgi:hypothetical protein